MKERPEKRNYYEILHVSRDAPAEIIRGSYRTLMQKLGHHPDLGGDTATAALINEAYSVLSNAERRADYDSRLEIMSQVADGFAEPKADPEPAREAETTHRRPLNLSRECAFCEAPHSLGNVVETESVCQVCGSPLYAAEQRRMESAGQRSIERIDKQQAITFFTHWPQQPGFDGTIEDISLNGLRMVSKQELVKGQRIKIVSDVVEAVATVTHCMNKRSGWTTQWVVGVSFITLRFGRSVGGFVSSHV
jgi:hypothetical protein